LIFENAKVDYAITSKDYCVLTPGEKYHKLHWRYCTHFGIHPLSGQQC